MIYAETEIKLKNGCTAVVRNARPEDAKKRLNTCAPFRANLRFYCVSRMR